MSSKTKTNSGNWPNWIISPNGRTPVRTENGIVKILVGGEWNYWDHPIYLDNKLIMPLNVERVTNRSGLRHKTHEITIGGVEFGKHRLEIRGQFAIIFYVNPLY